jgi:hypothetical protein
MTAAVTPSQEELLALLDEIAQFAEANSRAAKNNDRDTWDVHARKVREAIRLVAKPADDARELLDEEAANLAAHIWAAGADLETANFVATQLVKKNLRIVPDRATEAMWQAGRSADEAQGDSYSKVYLAMIEAAPRA